MLDAVPYYKEVYDLQRCASEPLHRIQRIQAYGEILICDQDWSCWYYASQQILENLETATIPEVVFNLSGTKIHTDDLNTPKTASSEIHPYVALFHEHEDYFIIEFEPRNSEYGTKLKIDDFQRSVIQLNESSVLTDFISSVCKEVQNITGYDHVMVYRFDEDYNGTVIEERKSNDRESYLGLKFPASDIPEQARELYKRESIRLVYSTSGEQKMIYTNRLSESKPELDLSEVFVRGVSPIHMEYLQNMGVQASFSVAITYQDRLWGLIACHHKEVRFISHEVRYWLKFVSMLISSNLEKLFLFNKELTKSNKRLLKSQMLEKIMHSKDLINGLLDPENSVMNLIKSDGVIIKCAEQIRLEGKTPNFVKVQQLLEWITEFGEFNVKSFSNTQKILPPEIYDSSIAGLLVVQLSHLSEDYLIWTRSEKALEVEWAGNIHQKKSFDQEKARLTPRKSFEKWKEEVEGQAEEWSTESLDIANLLKLEIREYLYKKYNEIALLNKELKDAYEQMESFSYSVSHDLKAPLRSIEGFTQIIKEDYSDAFDEYGLELLDIISNSIKRMNVFINDILKFSKLNRDQMLVMKINLNTLVQKNWKMLRVIEKYQNAVLHVEDLPPVYGDLSMINQVFHNLLENSLKYVNPGVIPQIDITSKLVEGFVEISLSDNGIGIPEDARGKVYEVFRRLVSEEDYEGTGVGMSIVKKAIDRHGGTIEISNGKNGQGTTFTFTLPTNEDYLSIIKNRQNP